MNPPAPRESDPISENNENDENEDDEPQDDDQDLFNGDPGTQTFLNLFVLLGSQMLQFGQNDYNKSKKNSDNILVLDDIEPSENDQDDGNDEGFIDANADEENQQTSRDNELDETEAQPHSGINVVTNKIRNNADAENDRNANMFESNPPDSNHEQSYDHRNDQTVNQHNSSGKKKKAKSKKKINTNKSNQDSQYILSHGRSEQQQEEFDDNESKDSIAEYEKIISEKLEEKRKEELKRASDNMKLKLLKNGR